jgi:hypothetical protein
MGLIGDSVSESTSDTSSEASSSEASSETGKISLEKKTDTELDESKEATTKESTSKSKLSLNYKQYLIVLITFLTDSNTVTERTADLITLNVNAVKQKVGESGELSSLSFKMDEAYTAVNATCSVQMDMVVMPKNFAKQVVDSSTYSELEEFEQNNYSFTVTRGY